MSFEISCLPWSGLVSLGQFGSVSDQHRMVSNTQTYKWMDGRLSLFDGLLRAPTVLITISPAWPFGGVFYPIIRVIQIKHPPKCL